MSNKLQRILENLVPFIILGIAIALLVGLFIMFSYVLVWGVIIGSVLWGINYLTGFLSRSKTIKDPTEKSSGRIIEHDDNETK